MIDARPSLNPEMIGPRRAELEAERIANAERAVIANGDWKARFAVSQADRAKRHALAAVFIDDEPYTDPLRKAPHADAVTSRSVGSGKQVQSKLDPRAKPA